MSSLNFVFWNINKGFDAKKLMGWLLHEKTLQSSSRMLDDAELLWNLADTSNSLDEFREGLIQASVIALDKPDVLLLAEAANSDVDFDSLSEGLEENGYINVFAEKIDGNSRLAVFRRKNASPSGAYDDNPIIECGKLGESESRYRLLKLDLLGMYRVFLVHFFSKGTLDYYSQISASIEIADIISKERRQTNSKPGAYNRKEERYIIAGDFNMNPWEPGMLLANGFCSSYAQLRENNLANLEQLPGAVTLTKSGKDYFPHYNPGWRLMGEANNQDRGQPLGTYNIRRKWDDKKNKFVVRKSSLAHYELEWNMLDQILVSPALIEHFDENRFTILNREQENKQCPSDHFPIYFTIKDPENGN